MKGLSLFSGGGIAETYLRDVGIDILCANEINPRRAEFYQAMHPETKMICGDITAATIYSSVIEYVKNAGIQFLLATPPCQGMSTLGQKNYESDSRNSLIRYIVKATHDLHPNYILIENVPKFLDLHYLPDYTVTSDKSEKTIVEALQCEFSAEYEIESKVLNAMNYGVPQSRPRAIIKLYKKGLSWPWPAEEKIITLRDAIGDLPSLESGEKSNLKWHEALTHNSRQIEALRHTPEGQSAMKNPVYYPKKADGTRVRGFHNTYNRMRWDEPAPARTTNSHLMSGHNNVHPGRQLQNGEWSDARVLTLRELLIVSSLPADWDIPSCFKEPEIREMIGEAIPPVLVQRIVAPLQGGN